MNIAKIFSKISRERDPTRGSIARESAIMTSYLWPNTALWILVHILNLFLLSRIGIEAVAAVAIGSAAFMLLMVPIRGIVTSTYGLVGGFDREDRIGLAKQVKQILSVTWFVSVVLALAGWFLAPLLLQFLGAESEVISSAIVYLRIQAVAGIIAFSFWPINQMIRNTGRMGQGMALMAAVLILQGIFDYLFIPGNFGFPQMGVAGASLSRGLSGAIGAGAAFCWLRKLIKLNLGNWQDFKINFRTLKEIIGIAGFDTVRGFCRQAVEMGMIVIISPFGTLALGAYEIGHRFLRYCSMFVADLAQTTGIGCARNLGAGKIKRARKWSRVNVGAAAGLMGCLGFLLFILAPRVLGIFSQDSEVIGIGINYFRITTLAGIGYVFFAGSLILEKAFAAAKDTLTPLLWYLGMAVLQIGLAITLPLWFGINGIWWAILAGMIFYGSALAIKTIKVK